MLVQKVSQGAATEKVTICQGNVHDLNVRGLGMHNIAELLLCGQPGYRGPGMMPGEVEPIRRTKRNLFRGWHAGRIPRNIGKGVEPEHC